MMKSILIIEDEILVARSIEQILINFGYNVVGIALNAKQAKHLVITNTIDLIISDINLNEEKSGIELIEEISRGNCIPFIFISSYSDRFTLEKAGKLSPFTYITKPFSDKQLVASVNRVFINQNDDSLKPTKRELSILTLVAKGYNTKEIGAELNISYHTVESHRKNLISKYNVKSMSELICLATTNKWIQYSS